MKKTFQYTDVSHTENTEEKKILKGFPWNPYFPCAKNMSIMIRKEQQ